VVVTNNVIWLVNFSVEVVVSRHARGASSSKIAFSDFDTAVTQQSAQCSARWSSNFLALKRRGAAAD